MPLTANWTDTRRLLALAGLATWLPRGRFLEEAYTSAGVVVATGELPLPRWFVLDPWMAWTIWGALVGALLLLLVRPSRIAALVTVGTGIVLVYTEGINEKAYDRLFLFQMTALAIAGAGSGSAGRHARAALTLVFCGIYGSTGVAKLFYEPAWADGSVLASHLVDADFGLRPLGLLAAQSGLLLAPMGWWTVAFEVGFPALVWWRRTRPWILLLGAGFHVGILATMHVNTFSIVALAGYPAMASAEEWARARTWLLTHRRPVLGLAAAGVLAAAVPWAATRLVGPWPGIAWTPPDVRLHRSVADHLDALLDADPAAVVAAAWGGPERTLGAGPRRVTLLATAGGEGADARTGVAVLLALAETWTPTDTTVTLSTAGPAGSAWSAPADLRVWIGPVGHVATSGGSQIWPGLGGVALTNRGTFLGVAGSRAFARRWAESSPVDVLALSGEWGPPDLPAGTIVLTDTGRWRSPRARDDTRAAIDVDQLARIVAGLARVLDGAPGQ